jgi:hypothetical protein
MSSSFAVSGTSQTQHRQSPFDQILSVEREQERRMHDAQRAIEEERIAEENTIRTQQDARVESSRAKAREELVQYKNTQLPQILTSAQERSEQDVARVLRESDTRVTAAAKSVVNAALSPDFPSLL